MRALLIPLLIGMGSPAMPGQAQEQQAKLAKLSEALQLGSAATEAVTFSLIAPRKPMRPVRYDQIR